MILEFGGNNCWSFKEWLRINMHLNKNVPSEYGFSDYPVVPLLCLEGGNASGKTVALRTLSFIMDFCRNSFYYDPQKEIPFDSFYNNDDKSEFYIKFSLPDDIETVYLYELVLTRAKVFAERLYEFDGKKKHKVFARRNNRIILNEIFGETEKVILRNNASFFSTLFQYQIKETDKFHRFFTNFSSNVQAYGSMDFRVDDSLAEYYFNHGDYLKRVISCLKRFDTGIEDIKILTAKNIEGKDVYYSFFIHDAKEKHGLFLQSESMGTRMLYNVLLDIFVAIDNGGVLVMDEVDAHLHSNIVPKMLDYFLDPAINTKHAQLLFTSHDSDLLDKAKKYRSYLFAKVNNESLCYRIDELPANIVVRNDRPISPLYKTGALGGIPNV